MSNLHLFELLNAPLGLSPLKIGLATVLAQWLIYLIPVMMVYAWARGDHAARLELQQLLVAMAIALGVAQVVAHVWPQPRPAALHVGVQYLGHDEVDPGLPSEHVTACWSVALAALASRRFSVWAFPLLALGLLVGWSRIYLGAHFPFDVLVALPVALVGAATSIALRGMLQPALERVLSFYDRCAHWLEHKLHPSHKA